LIELNYCIGIRDEQTDEERTWRDEYQESYSWEVWGVKETGERAADDEVAQQSQEVGSYEASSWTHSVRALVQVGSRSDDWKAGEDRNGEANWNEKIPWVSEEERAGKEERDGDMTKGIGVQDQDAKDLAGVGWKSRKEKIITWEVLGRQGNVHSRARSYKGAWDHQEEGGED
jgi:hypothetical protein